MADVLACTGRRLRKNYGSILSIHYRQFSTLNIPAESFWSTIYVPDILTVLLPDTHVDRCPPVMLTGAPPETLQTGWPKNILSSSVVRVSTRVGGSKKFVSLSRASCEAMLAAYSRLEAGH